MKRPPSTICGVCDRPEPLKFALDLRTVREHNPDALRDLPAYRMVCRRCAGAIDAFLAGMDIPPDVG